MNFILSALKGWKQFVQQKHVKIVFKKQNIQMQELECTNYGGTGSFYVCESNDNHSSQRSPQRNHPPCLLFSGSDNPVKTPLNGMSGLSAPYILMRAALPAIHSQLRSPMRTESWATCLTRPGRRWALEEEEKAEKEKASRIEGGGNYSGPKHCVGKGSVAAPSFSYLRVAKMTPGAG